MCFKQLLQCYTLCVQETLSAESTNTFISDKSSHAMPCLAPGSFCTICSVLTAPQRTDGSRLANGITLYNYQLTNSNSHFLYNSQSNIRYYVPSRCTLSIVSEFTKTYTGSLVIEGGSSAMPTVNDKCRKKLDMV